MLKAKEKKEIIEIANRLYGKFKVLDNITWKPYLTELYKMNLEDEKKHRSAGFENRDWETSKGDCALFFTVQQICQSYLNENKYTLKDLLHLRKACLYAQSIMMNYKNEIKGLVSHDIIVKFSQLDHMIFYNYEDWKNDKNQKKAG